MLSHHNHKIKLTGKLYGYKSASFDLPAGHSCPAANLCHSRVNVDSQGKRYIEDRGQFRCYAVKAEAQYTNVYNLRHANFAATREESFVGTITDEIQSKRLTLVRIHSSGDFYSWEYFQKWIQVIKSLPGVTFFAYTKQATFVKWYLENELPNFKLCYSMGGLHDKYATKHNLPHCTVIVDGFNPEGLPISCTHENPCDDFLYIMRGESFGINFH